MKLKKKFYFWAIILIIIVLLIFVINLISKKKSYNITYKIDGFTIVENYNKSNQIYTISTKYNSKNFDFVILSKRVKSKKLIEEVKAIKNEKEYCIYLKSNKLDIYPLCLVNDEIVSYNSTELSFTDDFYDVKFNNESFEFKNIKVNNLFNKNVLIWNNNGYYYINSKKSKEIHLFEDEKYYDVYSYKIKNYVLVPNYDQNYKFNEMIVINLKSGKTKTWDLDTNINYNFYYLGNYKNKSYLVDRKEKLEYELDPKKQKIKIVTNKDNYGIIWDNKWKEISMTKLVNDEYQFSYNQIFNYYLDKKQLYMSIDGSSNPIKLSNTKIDKIVQVDNNTVYYLSAGKLYLFNFNLGEQLLLEYSEWNFNQDNPIYIY